MQGWTPPGGICPGVPVPECDLQPSSAPECSFWASVLVSVNACVCVWIVYLDMFSLENESIIDFVVKFGWLKSSNS